MTFNETLATTGKSGPDGPDVPYSAAWWERLTAEELRDIINRGFSGGQVFQDAVSEAERRARLETRRLRDAAALETEQRNRKRFLALGAAAAASVTAAAGLWAIG